MSTETPKTIKAISCWKCGQFTRIGATKTHGTLNIIVRHRVCADPTCGKMTITYESPDMPLDLQTITKSREPRAYLIKRYIEVLDRELLEIEDVIDQHKAELKD